MDGVNDMASKNPRPFSIFLYICKLEIVYN